ncbi:FCD domain-containing protein [Dankookia sp. P2]|uniref:FCD domain-containing protein n=1 Tax=Dankookia sp. P2 TaxID=3423955 RepID=UPI003D67AA38
MASVEAQLELVQTKTLASLVQGKIVDMIRDGKLAAGEKLVEAGFTDKFGINRAAVREAFRALEEAGLVRLEKNRGAFVREFSRNEAIELYEMRACLEEMAGRRLAAVISDGQLSELTRLNNRLGTHARKNAIGQYYPLNVGFHDRLVELTGHGALLTIYRRLADQMHLLRQRGYGSDNRARAGPCGTRRRPGGACPAGYRGSRCSNARSCGQWHGPLPAVAGLTTQKGSENFIPRLLPVLQSVSSQPVSPDQGTAQRRRFPAVFGRDLDGATAERGRLFSPKGRRLSGP